VRTFENGKLKNDVFADKRLLAFPPGVSVLLLMFARFHNHAATQWAAPYPESFIARDRVLIAIAD
jgi:linoleate 10R-lipoxygenase